MIMLNKFLLLLLSSFILHTTLLAKDILLEYRINGIKNIEKAMDKELTNLHYWNEYLRDIDTQFGYIESYSGILTCDKSMSTLTLYSKDQNNSYKLQKKYSAFTGKRKGDKIREGDLKTPIGIYNITKKISKVDSFYGPMAFVTSYPNIYDKYRGKDGHGIWIHGLPTEQERDEFTKGCIAINNQNIECLDRHIRIDETILIINDKKIPQNIDKNSLAILLSQLYNWRYSWIYSDVDKYLSFYDSSFVRVDGMDYTRFAKYKKRVFAKNEKKEILFTKINVIPYPNTDDIYKISFKEDYRSTSFSFSGDKVLIVKLQNNSMKIITEK